VDHERERLPPLCYGSFPAGRPARWAASHVAWAYCAELSVMKARAPITRWGSQRPSKPLRHGSSPFSSASVPLVILNPQCNALTSIYRENSAHAETPNAPPAISDSPLLPIRNPPFLLANAGTTTIRNRYTPLESSKTEGCTVSDRELGQGRRQDSTPSIWDSSTRPPASARILPPPRPRIRRERETERWQKRLRSLLN
jgi:hypothetical protein